MGYKGATRLGYAWPYRAARVHDGAVDLVGPAGVVAVALEGQVEARRRYDEDYLRRGVSMLAVEGSTPQILRSVPFLSSLETLGVKVSPKNIYIAPPELPRQN